VREVIQVLRTERKAAVLAPSQLTCLSRLPTINLTAGCAHECLYCYARSYSRNPGPGRIILYADTLKKLRAELPRKRKRPRVIYFSPASDAFQPVEEVLDLAFHVFEFLLRHGVGVAFLTKGRIPVRHMDLLKAHSSKVHAGIGVTTLDHRVWRAFEPGTAPPEVRMAQIAALLEAGIDTQVRLDPILPGVTDDERTFHEVFAALGGIGVRNVAISTAFMRPAIVRNLWRRLPKRGLAEALLSHYHEGPILVLSGAGTYVRVPPEATRRAIYDRVRRIARGYNVSVLVCACKNGDLARGSCHIHGSWDRKPDSPKQITLFD
jgi:DNA repair photolyase